jgi:hypothetical protein
MQCDIAKAWMYNNDILNDPNAVTAISADSHHQRTHLIDEPSRRRGRQLLQEVGDVHIGRHHIPQVIEVLLHL